jgi:hypothetical protein
MVVERRRVRSEKEVRETRGCSESVQMIVMSGQAASFEANQETEVRGRPLRPGGPDPTVTCISSGHVWSFVRAHQSLVFLPPIAATWQLKLNPV